MFEKWAAAEEAMEALNGTMQSAGAANPIVVKFADGKPKAKANGSGVGMKRGNEAETSALSKRMNLGSVRPWTSVTQHAAQHAAGACWDRLDGETRCGRPAMRPGNSSQRVSCEPFVRQLN